MTPRLVRLPFVAALLAFSTALIAQTPAPAPSPALLPVPAKVITTDVKPNPDEMIPSFKISGLPIDGVLSALELHTGRSILRPAALQTAEYTLVIDRPIPRSELVLAIETLLALNQIGVVPLGERFLKVVGLANAKTEAPEMITGLASDQPASGKIATKVFQFDFLRVNEFVPQLGGLLTPGIGGGLVVLDKTNAALITDSVSNLQRIESLIKALDRPATSGLIPKFYPLKSAKASDLVNKLRTILQGTLQTQLGTSTTYSADDRTNQIILIADARQYPFFDELIGKLDVKADPNTRNEVIYLKHAAAKDVSTLLVSIVTGQTNAAQKTAAQSVRPGQVVIPGQPVAPQPVGPQPAMVNLAGPDANLAGGNEFSALAVVTYDERSNAVIVSGTGDDIRLIKDLVDKIDIVLAQVRIEVIIAEVTLSDTDKSGISKLNLTVGPTAKGATSITNFATDVAGWSVSKGVVNPFAFEAALGDAGSRGNVNILSAPTIVTTHNKEAQVIVGQSQPIITGSTSTPNSGTAGLTTSSQVTYKDIAIDLKVTPLIGDDGSIQLKIDQKVDDILDSVTIDGNAQPVIGRRQATSFINVIDGEMIVLGGLQRTKTSRSRGKLGFLTEIPILSQIFGARENKKERTELLLFVRPHVIKPGEGSSDTSKNINVLSNKDQINHFLVDPSKPAKVPLLEKLK
ncbi:MAG: type II secretory pathway, component PulD [Undibacterium sp.]|nr:type II secretory pathway, component PulD [Opitutaceae bacterium]